MMDTGGDEHKQQQIRETDTETKIEGEVTTG